MKKFLLPLLILFPLLINAQTFDIRQVNWGMTKNEVKKSESLPVAFETDFGISYNGFASGFKAYMLYSFDEGKLNIFSYSFEEKYAVKNQYILDYNKLKDALTEKYGAPIEDKVIWIDDLYKGETNYYGNAVAKGALKYQSIWVTERSKIILMLSGKNYECSLRCSYASLEWLKKHKKPKSDL